MIRTAFTALVAIAMAAPAAAQSAERLSVDAAVAIALKNSRSLTSAEWQSEKAALDLETARSRRLPKFTLEAQASQLLRPVHVLFPQGAFGTYPGIGPVPAADTAVTTSAQPVMVLNAQATQPLSQLYELTLNVRMSEAAVELERETVRATRLTLVYEVKRLYYSIVRSESAIEAADHTLALLRELGRVSADRVFQKVALKSEALDVSARLARAEQQRLVLRNTVASQKEQLNQLLGRDVRTEFTTDGIPGGDVAAADLGAAQTRALEARPGLRQARLKQHQADIARRLARADRLPDLSLAVSYYSPINIDGAPRNIATVGLQFTWEPFDWGRRSRALAVKNLEVRQAVNAVRDEEDRALIEVNARFRRLEETRAAVLVAGMAQDTARETGRVRAAQYRAQSALLSDVLQAAANQADADNQYQQALADLWLATAEFERALGED